MSPQVRQQEQRPRTSRNGLAFEKESQAVLFLVKAERR
jgi:hypothetical protein